MINLKECPFCGGTAELVIFQAPFGGQGAIQVECRICGAKIHPVESSLSAHTLLHMDNEEIGDHQAVQDAAFLWNRRFADGN